MNKPWWQSSTITGALGAAACAIAPYVIHAIPQQYAVVGVVLGWAVSQIGQRQAIAKNGTGQ